MNLQKGKESAADLHDPEYRQNANSAATKTRAVVERSSLSWVRGPVPNPNE